MVVCFEYPCGVAIILTHPVKEYEYFDAYKTDGIIEDFLRYLIPDPSPLYDHVELSVDAIPANEIKFTELAKPKVLIHTWLAWQEDPGYPYGLAITAKFLDPDVPEAKTFVDWLNRLYLLTP